MSDCILRGILNFIFTENHLEGGVWQGLSTMIKRFLQKQQIVSLALVASAF